MRVFQPLWVSMCTGKGQRTVLDEQVRGVERGVAGGESQGNVGSEDVGRAEARAVTAS